MISRSLLRTLAVCLLHTSVALTIAHAATDDDRILVVNGLAETLDLIDRTSGTVLSSVLTLGLAPNEMALADGAVLLTNSISDDLWVTDRDSYSVIRTIDFQEGDNPYDVEVIDDSLCAVSLTLANAVMIVDYQSGDTLQRVPVGLSPQGLYFDGDALWVTNTALDYNTFAYGQGTVDVIDLSSASVISSLNVGSNPQVIARAGDGTLHVLCTGNYFDLFGIVYVIDKGTQTVLDSIVLGGSPGDLAIGNDGMAYIAAGGWVDSGYVYRYESGTRTVLNGDANPWKSALGALGVAPRLEGGVWVYCFGADSVIGHGLNGQVEEAYQLGDGPQPGVHISNRIPGDLNDDGFPDAADLNALIDLIFFGGPDAIHRNSADLDHSCQADAVDLNRLIDLLFFGGTNSYWGCLE